MKVVLGADHAGFELKERIKAHLIKLRHDGVDLGRYSNDPVDYPSTMSRSMAMTCRRFEIGNGATNEGFSNASVYGGRQRMTSFPMPHLSNGWVVQTGNRSEYLP